MNSVHLIGNLGDDPETRSTGSGNTVANLRIATNSRVKREGEWVDQTEWHRVTVWGKQAESCARFLRKGAKVGVEGRLQTRKWTDRDGADRYTTEVVAHRVHFLTKAEASGSRSGGHGGRSGGRSGGGGYGGGGYGGGGYGGRDSAGGMDIDEIPF